mmetsp:Transcript_9049/g.27690  ORF Transcript_9049/g.27690 Transcript_9049/m.27690 type:complete len:221 (-) Transcript_9049:697-1359(-)
MHRPRREHRLLLHPGALGPDGRQWQRLQQRAAAAHANLLRGREGVYDGGLHDVPRCSLRHRRVQDERRQVLHDELLLRMRERVHDGGLHDGPRCSLCHRRVQDERRQVLHDELLCQRFEFDDLHVLRPRLLKNGDARHDKDDEPDENQSDHDDGQDLPTSTFVVAAAALAAVVQVARFAATFTATIAAFVKATIAATFTATFAAIRARVNVHGECIHIGP